MVWQSPQRRSEAFRRGIPRPVKEASSDFPSLPVIECRVVNNSQTACNQEPGRVEKLRLDLNSATLF